MAKKYKIIYADPAWKYNDKQNTTKLGDMKFMIQLIKNQIEL